MTRIDYYVSDDSAPNTRVMLACRLAEKAYEQQQRVYIHTASDEQARQVDDLLWTFKAGSFLPHGLTDTTKAADCTILIGHDHQPDQHIDVLINLDEEVPGFFSRFTRVLEIVDNDEGKRSKARERYKFYRDRGYTLETHKLGKG